MATDCEKWLNNQLVNPVTGRSIKLNGPTYNKLVKMCGPASRSKSPTRAPKRSRSPSRTDCDKWFDSPLINPMTGRAIKLDGPTYKKYAVKCKSPTRKSPTRSSSSTISYQSSKSPSLNVVPFILRTATSMTICQLVGSELYADDPTMRKGSCINPRKLWTLPAGSYKARILHDNVLDIVDSRGQFISDVKGSIYDWSGSFQDEGYKIESEIDIGELNYDGYTVAIGKTKFTGKFNSFSLTGEPRSDEGYYDYVINKYRTPNNKIGVIFSGSQNDSDYTVRYDLLHYGR